MTRCNATLNVGGQIFTCEKTNHPGRDGHANIDAEPGHWSEHAVQEGNARLLWTDGAPAATPHREPVPTYRAAPGPDGDWTVEAVGDAVVCEFAGGLHPDPEGAAKAEAARLRGDMVDGTRIMRERDEARKRADVLEAALRECETDHLTSESADELRAERLRYRKALERIEFLGSNPTMRDTLPASYEIARRVLDGGEAR